MESKISKLKEFIPFSPLHNLQGEWVRGCGAKILGFILENCVRYPGGVPEVFLACGGNFRCWPKADTTSVVGRSHERQPRLKSLWHPGYVSGDLQLVLQHCCETGLKAMLRFSLPTFKPVFTKQVVTSCVTTDF